MNDKETLNAYKARLEDYLDKLPMTGAPDKLRQAYAGQSGLKTDA